MGPSIGAVRTLDLWMSTPVRYHDAIPPFVDLSKFVKLMHSKSKAAQCTCTNPIKMHFCFRKYQVTAWRFKHFFCAFIIPVSWICQINWSKMSMVHKPDKTKMQFSVYGRSKIWILNGQLRLRGGGLTLQFLKTKMNCQNVKPGKGDEE